MRLIDLDKIKSMDFPSCEMDGLDVVRYLETLPTVDAAPVVHGRWEDMGDFCQCSACNGTRLKEIETHYGKAAWVKTTYCPNCGAKMDLEEIKNG